MSVTTPPSSSPTAPHTPLPTPKPITEHNWPAGTRPVVSICCITYNHRGFIADAIEGFLMQETTFPVEIIIHDDASTDGTSEIVRGYRDRYPRLIQAILQTENQYSKGKKPGVRTRSLAQGSFVAYCEGDDYWTDPLKLQKQVSWLEEYPEAVIAAHAVNSVEHNVHPTMPAPSPKPPTQTFISSCELIEARVFIPTLSMLYRNINVYRGRSRYLSIVNGDVYLRAMLAEYGGAIISNEAMGVYRKHAGGVWSGVDAVTQQRNRVQVRKVVCLDIAPSRCLPACRGLAAASYSGARILYAQHTRLIVTEFLPAYIFSMLCCFRSLQAGPRFIIPATVTALLIPVTTAFEVVRGISRRCKRMVQS